MTGSPRWPWHGQAQLDPVPGLIVVRCDQDNRTGRYVRGRHLARGPSPKSPVQGSLCVRLTRLVAVRNVALPSQPRRTGPVAEWLCRGLQSPVHRFDSGPGLQSYRVCSAREPALSSAFDIYQSELTFRSEKLLQTLLIVGSCLMTEFETIFLLGVIAAFVAFSATLAWASVTSGGKPN